MDTSDAGAILRELQRNFELYAPHHLTLVDKITRERRPFSFNSAQKLLHAEVEKMRAEIGRVMMAIVKGRQQGVSTYVTGRGYWRTSLNRNINAYILSHEVSSTQTLFEMVQSYHDHCPQVMRPYATTDAANSLKFGRIGSGYAVATARTRESGRSKNLQFFHGSEVGHWPSLKKNLASAGQAISPGPGVEVYMETTGNGRNEYFDLVQSILKGDSDYRLCFIPWFLSPEYSREVPKEFDITEDDFEYKETYGLTLRQMAWRRFKTMSDFGGDTTLFDQEYPASLMRAFARSATDDPFIKTKNVEKARKRERSPLGPKLLGIDPSLGKTNSDRFSFIERDHARVTWKGQLRLATDDVMEAANHVAKVIEQRNPDAIFIDRLGMGAGVCDRLVMMMPNRMIFGVKASESAADGERYNNKRTEMWGEVRDWIATAQLLDDDELEADLTGPGFKYVNGAYQLETKEKMLKRGVRSPDCLVAGTMVATPQGDRPIESLRVGDVVLTPMGESPVICAMASIGKTVSARFSNGRELVGTGKHSVFSWLGGSVRMDALTRAHAVDTIEERFRWLNASLSSTGVRGSGFKARVATFSPAATVRRSDFFTGASGQTITARFHQALTSITRMTTGAITRSTTWRRCQSLNIAADICSSAWPIPPIETRPSPPSQLRSHFQQSGIDQKRAVDGTRRTGSPRGSAERLFARRAKSVALGSMLRSTEPGSAADPATQRSTTSDTRLPSANASSVVDHLWRMFTGRRRVVPVDVVPSGDGPKPVYNLTLARDNAYYANGILVFNCGDALAHTFYAPFEIVKQLDRESRRSGAARSWKVA